MGEVRRGAHLAELSLSYSWKEIMSSLLADALESGTCSLSFLGEERVVPAICLESRHTRRPSETCLPLCVESEEPRINYEDGQRATFRLNLSCLVWDSNNCLFLNFYK